MEKRYLSIKEFAEMANVSQQSIYKRLKNKKSKLNNYITTVENQKKIDVKALKEVYNIEVEQPFKQSITMDEQPKNSTEILIEALQSQLKEKDEQLARMQKLLDQQQQLSMADRQRVIMLEEKLQSKEQSEEEPQKKHWWQKIF